MKHLVAALLLVAACSKSKVEPKPDTITVEPKAADSKAVEPMPDSLDVKISAKTIEPADLRSILATRGHPTWGTVSLADDARFEQLVAVLDAGRVAGTELAVVVADLPRSDVEPPAPDPEHAAIIVLSPTAISILEDKTPHPLVRLDALAAGQDIPELGAAFDAMQAKPTTVVIQADKDTSGAVLNRTLRTVRRLGNPAVLFAYKDAQP